MQNIEYAANDCEEYSEQSSLNPLNILISAKDQNSLKWLDANQRQFPILAQLARKYPSIQATSGASERVFSDAGLIMSAKRTSMKEDLFEALIFLKRNGNLVGGMFNNDTYTKK